MTTTNTWQSFLQQQSTTMPTLQEQLSATANKSVMTDLSHRGLIEISGEDAVTFLQGQLTNDIKALNGYNSQFAGYCNAKGRLLALFFAFSVDNTIYLQVNDALTESILKRLKMFVLRSKVTLSDASNMIRIGVAGENAAQVLAQFYPSIPQQPFALSRHENTVITRLPTVTPMFEIFIEENEAVKLYQAMRETCTFVSKDAWDWLEIQAGIPDIATETQEAFVPQMVNLDALGGISFKKGCYTGQEIVARTHYLGSVKRRTQLAHLATDNAPKAGDAITDNNQQAIGLIVRSAPAIDGGYDVLAECRLENIAQGQVFWQSHALEIKPLPYAL
jgi:folate-binding protein YgfZ